METKNLYVEFSRYTRACTRERSKAYFRNKSTCVFPRTQGYEITAYAAMKKQ